MTTGALIVAAGRGLRAGADRHDDLPKQYRNISGRPMLWHTLIAFIDHPQVDFVLPVIHADDVDLFQAASVGLGKLLPPVFGGATRQQSVLAGLENLASPDIRKILIHDGARPFISHSLIDETINTLDRNQAVLPACPVTDTLRRGHNGLAADLVDRENLYASQTPQGFHYESILRAHRLAAKQSDVSFTDDGEIARWAGMDVALIDGDVDNVKITHGKDFEMAELKLNPAQSNVRTGLGFDVHAFGPGDAVTICGVRIPHHAALRGHSDADVGLHAITDAILGAISAGDIGTHFPPSDDKWKGADSAVFLQHAGQLVGEAGGAIGNVDVTIICEAPKMGPHRDAMRGRIAEILKLDLDRVGVKATTTEKLGFTGRGEGIAAQAIATVYLP